MNVNPGHFSRSSHYSNVGKGKEKPAHHKDKDNPISQKDAAYQQHKIIQNNGRLEAVRARLKNKVEQRQAANPQNMELNAVGILVLAQINRR